VGRGKNNIDTLELCARAGEILKRVGFVHHQTSMTTPAVYYRWPDRQHLLRVAEHSGKKTRKNGGLGVGGSSVTFNGTHLDPPGKMNIREEKIESTISAAIGRYFMKSAPDSTPRNG